MYNCIVILALIRLLREQRYSKHTVAMNKNIERRFISSAAHDQGCVMKVSVTDTKLLCDYVTEYRVEWNFIGNRVIRQDKNFEIRTWWFHQRMIK